ncbi:hypothetical protein BpHYR1_050789 [Brachionus plicatilis]|uniref:Uncharacterized protein n=1 Tax=Brachionus plicatilis TaxID=10195 RepID=A0A3M7RYG4_BRAPC|nr:hypothetical protein BpHYR1_050789 [Brachionus plicatilis]
MFKFMNDLDRIENSSSFYLVNSNLRGQRFNPDEIVTGKTVNIYIVKQCWAAAKPGRSERGQNKAATLAGRPAAGQIVDGRPNVRPILKRAATLAGRPAAKSLDRGVGRPNN